MTTGKEDHEQYQTISIAFAEIHGFDGPSGKLIAKFQMFHCCS
jgi:hypothetical protein